jgi:hypothetical protein
LLPPVTVALVQPLEVFHTTLALLPLAILDGETSSVAVHDEDVVVEPTLNAIVTEPL